jgi:hypothetical protein
MKTYILTLVLSSSIKAQEVEIDILTRVNSVNYIFEGTVINSQSYFTNNNRYIHTSNTVEITKILKGEIACGTVEIITDGGRVGNMEVSPSHSLTLGEGSSGIFLCSETNRPLSPIDFYPENNLQKLEAHYEDQSFIRYWWDGYQVNAADMWYNFDSLALVYNAAELITGLNFVDCKQSPKFGNFGPTISKKQCKKKEISLAQKEANKKLYAKRVQFATQQERLLLDRYEASLLNKNKAKSAAPIEDITFDITNEQVTGSNPQYFEFDIMVSGSSNATYFDNALFLIEYNTFSLGSDISLNNTISITSGTNFNNSTYINPMSGLIDYTSNQVRFSCGVDNNAGSWNRTQLTTNLQQLAHIKIEIQNCVGTADLQFMNTTFLASFALYQPTPTAPSASIPPTLESYDNVYFNQTTPYAFCPPPSISGFSPTTVAGGIKQILTINGSGFGSTQGGGKVYFKNADYGGNSEVWTDPADIHNWGDTQIEIYVPSYDFGMNLNNQGQLVQKGGQSAGSGEFRVYTDAGNTVTSTGTLTIEYSVKNDSIKDSYMLAPWSQFNNKFVFHCETAVANYDNGKMKAAIKKAIHDWNCFTTINWELGNDTTYNGNIVASDQACIIHFASLPTNIIAQASTWQTYCSSKPIIVETDIQINSNHNYFCDTVLNNIVPLGEKDLYAAILHELGHAHVLNHVIGIDNIMHYQEGLTSTGARRIDLISDNSCYNGGTWVMDFSTNPLNITATSNCANVTNITSDPNPLCAQVGLGTTEIKSGVLKHKVYPNPFLEKINIELQSLKKEQINIRIADLNGRVLLNNKSVIYKGSNLLNLNTEDLAKGFYILNIYSNNGNTIFNAKIIK